ncbi:universal stress protein [Actinoplanes missouriensis]|uniref:universal stress protein n=1 Tax=Actinoplanes missouriensis TaxID=1866 RepID=UPI0033E665BC
MRTPTIVVGTDGAASGNEAVRWAAREAVRRDLTLQVVHVLDWDGGTSALAEFAGNNFALARELADIVAAAGVATAHDAAPEVEAEPLTLVGRPAARLLAAAERAELLVVGTRRRNRLAGLVFGSVSRRVARHAPCPVRVVDGSPGATRQSTHGGT